MSGFRLMLLGVVVVAPLAMCAQGFPASGAPVNPSAPSGQTSPGPVASNADASANNSGGVDVGLMKDKIFLRRATMTGLAEINFAQIAMQKAGSDDVKNLAARMIADHTALNESLKPIAQGMGVALPTSLNRMDKAEEDKLNGLSGGQFDKEFLAYLAQDHHRDLKTFQAEADSTADADLKDAVVKGQKTIAEHARKLDKLAAANGVPPDTANKP